jgi:outer membrane protein TolC
MKRLFLIFVAGFSFQAQAITLEEYLIQVSKNNRSFQAIDASLSAAETRYEGADLELSPFLTASAAYTDDKSNGYLGSLATSHAQTRSYSLGLNKKFSSGTQAAVVASVQAINAEGTAAGTATSTDVHVGSMAISLSQSLWKDFFGRSTRLRWERQEAQQAQEKSRYNLNAKQAQIQAEGIFWDLVYLEEEWKIRKDSLERAQRIEGWVKRRAGNGIGDRADVLNAEALRASRQLQLNMTEDNLFAARKNFADQLELGPNDPIPKLEANLDKERSPLSFADGAEVKGKILRLDSYLAALEARSLMVSSREAEEKVRPDLTLEGSYRTNGYDTTDSAAIGKMNDKDKPVAYVGVKFNWALDWGTTGAIKSTANADAMAAKLTKERKLLESETAWTELARRHKELSNSIRLAEITANLQNARANAQRDKLSKGRTVLLDVVTAEQDAAESALNMKKMKVEQRKLESQGRLFVKIEEQL